tara:strand:+ start:1795 stop:2343 length:549 start_codon:yes stop_codon:yes gene_type:complete
MKNENQYFDGLVLISPDSFSDSRGEFYESYNKKVFFDLIGDIKFVQDNISKSKKNTIRGLHFQNPPFTQSKLVTCLSGSIIDIVVDLRKKSSTFGCCKKTFLNEKNKKQLFVPKGFAHGFSVTSEHAIVSYKVDNYYNKKFENGILWNDKLLNIDWEIDKSKLIVSKKDNKLLKFDKFINPF